MRTQKHRAAILSILEQSEQAAYSGAVFLELKERGEPANLPLSYGFWMFSLINALVKKLNITVAAGVYTNMTAWCTITTCFALAAKRYCDRQLPTRSIMRKFC